MGEGKAHQFHTHFVNPWLPEWTLGFLRKGHVPSLFRSCLYYSKIQNVPSIAPQSYFVYFTCVFSITPVDDVNYLKINQCIEMFALCLNQGLTL